MDYRKTNAPVTTVTRDMMELCEDTGNVYETVALVSVPIRSVLKSRMIFPRSWQSSLLTMIILKKYSRIANRLRFPVTMRNCRNRH